MGWPSIITGYGIQTAVVYQSKIANNLSWHGGSGVLWGFLGIGKEYNSSEQLRSSMAFGIMWYMGMGWQVSDKFRLNAEVNPICQINTFEESTHFIISPTVGLGYTIKTKWEREIMLLILVNILNITTKNLSVRQFSIA